MFRWLLRRVSEGKQTGATRLTDQRRRHFECVGIHNHGLQHGQVNVRNLFQTRGLCAGPRAVQLDDLVQPLHDRQEQPETGRALPDARLQVRTNVALVDEARPAVDCGVDAVQRPHGAKEVVEVVAVGRVVPEEVQAQGLDVVDGAAAELDNVVRTLRAWHHEQHPNLADVTVEDEDDDNVYGFDTFLDQVSEEAREKCIRERKLASPLDLRVPCR